MKKSTFYWAVYASFLAFSLSVVFIGETGIAALRGLEQKSSQLRGNLAELDDRKTALSRSLSVLQSDSETIAVQARSLGLYQAGDRVLRFRNMESVLELPEAGEVLHFEALQSGNDDLLRLFALSVGVVVLLIRLIGWKDAVPAK